MAEIEYEVRQTIDGLDIVLRLTDAMGNIITTSWDTDDIGGDSSFVRRPGRYRSICKLPSDLLRPGSYFLTIGSHHKGRRLEMHENVLAFEVSQVDYHLKPRHPGLVLPFLEWETKQVGEQESPDSEEVRL